MDTNISKNNHSISQIHFLEFFAFILIFLYFARGYLNLDYCENLGLFGVNFYFMCSGFTTGLAKIGKDIKEISINNIFQDVKTKIIKFYPLYFTTVVLGVTLTDLPKYLSVHDFQGIHIICSQLVLTLLMLQSWVNNGLYYMFNPVCCFFSSMLLLYCMNVPLLVFFKKIKTNMKKMIVCCVISFLFVVLYGFFTPLITEDLYWVYLFPPARIGEYILGMALGIIMHEFGNSTSVSRPTKSISTILEFISLVIWIGIAFVHIPSGVSATVIWIIPNAMLLVIFASGKGLFSCLFNKRIPARLGQISIGCFFIHPLIIFICSRLLGLDSVSNLGNYFMILYDLTLTILLSLQLIKRKF